MRRALTAPLLVAFSAAGLCCQPAVPPPSLSFEVASIKLARNSGSTPICGVPCTGERLTVAGDRVDIRYMSLHQLIVRAYRIKQYQLSGPKWMTSQRFDIAAKMPDAPSKDRIPEMLQALLAERFGLSIHRESKEQPVFALVVGQNGPKLKVSAVKADVSVPEAPGGQTLYTPFGEARIRENRDWQIREGPYGPIRMSSAPNATTRVDFLRITMPGLAEALTPSVDRVVVDATGLKGVYQLQVDWSVPPPMPSPVAAVSPLPAPSLSFQSLERGGLKLENRKAPVEMIVVDRLEKMPASN